MEAKKVYKKWRMKEKKAWGKKYKVGKKIRRDTVKNRVPRASGGKKVEAHKGKKHQRK